nr:amino acid permease [Alicyclobacillus ferrooxydans]
MSNTKESATRTQATAGTHDATTQDLKRQLKPRHIIMMALGGAIGAGLFKGSDTSINQTGPGALAAYLLGGLILLFVMQGLGEMAVHHPQARTFRELIHPLLGPFAAHLTGWIYWLDWVLVMAAETAASAGFLTYWFPTVPVWLLALIVSVVMTVLNLFQVGVYGETEYWMSGIKIVVLALFVIFGIILLFTGFHGQPAPRFSHLTDAGGFFPHGLNGFASSLLVVMFSFGGTEMIGMTLGETDNPARIIPRAARGVIFRILLFYVLPILVIVSLVPWNHLGAGNSPFVTVFQSVGIPYVAGVMNFVMLTAVLSATNSGMYAASRMLYTQSLSGQAPRFFTQLSNRKVPIRALLVSTSFLYVGVIVAFFAKGNTFGYLMTIPGYSVILVWILIAAAHLKSRSQRKGAPHSSTGGSVIGSWFALFALVAIFIGVVATTPIWGTIVMVIVLALVTVGYFMQDPKRRTTDSN